MGSMQHASPTAVEVRAGIAKPEGDRTLAPLTWALRVKDKTEDCAGSKEQSAGHYCQVINAENKKHWSLGHKS